ncbi:hypothetical protein FLA105534_02935 [Flavobacterium bizetiae]|uniref:Uncharacterized protein n=1 Tax=Flavobacterium bizetiae TaxID=2704140 RepID=A0A6J4GLJ4_9FLAO|nr:hypothetical protein [Flavobacterium bizetiae]CAA9200039.1 hypothetical protein FLA105534_02935 [Flavobacterium bizetiae]CAD5343484.1 hypothetical protein FLA105535_03482 [Flavobacterium bizetiae]CAD5349477.1 hypothetical protein FLA105534_03461 [Flavobacterium bizetiae]
MKKYFFALILCFQISFSQSTDHLNTVLKQLKIKKSEIHEKLFTQKILPYDKSKSVLVIPKYDINEQDNEGHDYFVLDAYIVVIDNATGKIICKFIEPNAWTSDALMLNGISIDTGLYHLNSTTRAFGVRVDYTGSSRPNPFSETHLSLYVADKNSLKQVLKNYSISRSGGEWDTNCAGEFEDRNSTFDIAQVQTNNYNNIIVRSTIVKSVSTPTIDDCVSKETTKKTTSKLIFNGKEYK